jgi:hypothetical protein
MRATPRPVQLPDGAIDAHEILDEPGIVSTQSIGGLILTTTMQDLETVTITTPAPGFISLAGSSSIQCSGTTGFNLGYLQIDETAGGSPTPPYDIVYGNTGTVSSGSVYWPVHAQRVYFKAAGTYTFRLEACMNSSNGIGAAQSGSYPRLTAYFFPTSYGSVVAIASNGDAEEFTSARAVSIVDPLTHTTQSVQQVDLRELELKAAKTRADAETAARKLAEAKLAQRINQDNQTIR